MRHLQRSNKQTQAIPLLVVSVCQNEFLLVDLLTKTTIQVKSNKTKQKRTKSTLILLPNYCEKCKSYSETSVSSQSG